MVSFAEQCAANADAVLSALPKTLGFRRRCVHDGVHDLESPTCVIRLAFKRYEASRLESIDIFEAFCKDVGKHGMAFWVLRHIRGIAAVGSGVVPNPFVCIGELLTIGLLDVLSGDFSIRQRYDHLQSRILDHMSDIRELPISHPARIRFENYDIRWLDDFGDVKGVRNQ